jgi:hypothetical protein
MAHWLRNAAVSSFTAPTKALVRGVYASWPIISSRARDTFNWLIDRVKSSPPLRWRRKLLSGPIDLPSHPA